MTANKSAWKTAFDLHIALANKLSSRLHVSRLVYRSVQVLLALHNLLAVLALLAAGAWAGRTWGWKQRLGLWSLLVQLGVPAAGLVLPSFSQHSSCAQHDHVLHQVLVSSIAFGGLLEYVSGLGSITVCSSIGLLLLEVPLAASWAASSHQPQQLATLVLLAVLLVLTSTSSIFSLGRAQLARATAATATGLQTKGLSGSLYMIQHVAAGGLVVLLLYQLHLQRRRPSRQQSTEGTAAGLATNYSVQGAVGISAHKSAASCCTPAAQLKEQPRPLKGALVACSSKQVAAASGRDQAIDGTVASPCGHRESDSSSSSASWQIKAVKPKPKRVALQVAVDSESTRSADSSFQKPPDSPAPGRQGRPQLHIRSPVPVDAWAHAASGNRRTSADDTLSQLLADQQLVGDVLQTLLGLIPAVAEGPQLVMLGRTGAAGAAAAAGVVGTVCAVLFTVSMFPQLVYLLLRPRSALATREVWWPLVMAGAPVVHQVALQLLRQPSPFSLRFGLVQLAAVLGLLDISAASFTTWLPVTMAAFYSLVAVRHWSSMSWGLRAWVAVEFNLLPIAGYAVVRAACRLLRMAVVRSVSTACRALGGRKVTSWQRAARIAAAVLAEKLLGMLLVGALYAVSAEWSDADAVLTVRSLGPVREMLSKDGVRNIAAGLLICCCLMVSPTAQLCLMGDMQQGQPRPARPTATVNRQSQGAVNQQATAGACELGLNRARHQQLVFERLLCAATAVQTLWGTYVFLQAVVSSWRAGATLLAAAVVARIFQAAVAVVHTIWIWRWPASTMAHRDAMWTAQGAMLPCLVEWASAIAGSTTFQAPLLQAVARAAWLAAAGVTPASFGAWLPVLAATHFGYHAWGFPVSRRPWLLLALDGFEYGTYPILAYHLVSSSRFLKAACQALQRHTFHPRAPQGAGVVAAAVLRAGLVVPQVWVALLGLLPKSLCQTTSTAKATVIWAVVHAFQQLSSTSEEQQAYILASPAFADSRRYWYDSAKARVLALCEVTLGRLVQLDQVVAPQEMLAVLLDTLRSTSKGMFPGCTLMLALKGEEGSDEAHMVNRYLVTASREAQHLPALEQLCLEDLPSVEVVCKTCRPIWRAGLSASTVGYSDWAALLHEHGMDSFLVVPLSCNNRVLGALTITCITPVTLDKFQQQLAEDLGRALSHTLYTLACAQQMHAGEEIIHDILPRQVAKQLRHRMGEKHERDLRKWVGRSSMDVFRRTGSTTQYSSSGIPVVYRQWHPSVSVLFADIVDFATLSQDLASEQVMELLHELFSKYDALCHQYGIYKVETVGDSYMACAGVLEEDSGHAQHLVEFGQAMIRAAASVPHPMGGCVHVRVGVNSGRVMSGIVGNIRARYCLFGDTVNTASRMMSTGVVDRVQLSPSTFELLGTELRKDFEVRDAFAVKGKGMMAPWLLRQETSLALQHQGVALGGSLQQQQLQLGVGAA